MNNNDFLHFKIAILSTKIMITDPNKFLKRKYHLYECCHPRASNHVGFVICLIMDRSNIHRNHYCFYLLFYYILNLSETESKRVLFRPLR